MDLPENEQKTGISPAGRPFLGVLIFILGIVAGSFFAKFQERHVARVNLDVVGADISRAGGTSLFVASTDGFLRQTCIGVCDEVSYSFKNRSAEYTIRIDNSAGECIFCPGTYTDSYLTNDEKISGKEKLELTSLEKKPVDQKRKKD